MADYSTLKLGQVALVQPTDGLQLLNEDSGGWYATGVGTPKLVTPALLRQLRTGDLFFIGLATDSNPGGTASGVTSTSAGLPNFTITNAGQQVTASQTSGSTAVALSLPSSGSSDDVLIYNPGPDLCYVLMGGPSVSSDATCMPILPGEKGAWGRGGATHVAAYCSSGSQVLSVIVGVGA